MQGSRVFLDTNTLLYVHDLKEQLKGAAVARWLERLAALNRAVVNLQVLNEAANVMLRGRWFDSPGTVYGIIDDFAELGSQPVGWREVEMARLLHDALRYTWWDCLLLASALELDCTYFLSEDLQNGQRVETGGRGLTIINPFAHTPDEILSR